MWISIRVVVFIIKNNIAILMERIGLIVASQLRVMQYMIFTACFVVVKWPVAPLGAMIMRAIHAFDW